MTNDDDQPARTVRDLVFEYLERVEEEGHGVLDELCAREPAHADALRARVGVLHGTGLSETTAGATEPPQTLGPFRLLEPIGGGGMGVVYRALDEQLGREVAVKVVRPGELLFPNARARFQREVESVARLSHPGIVPVFSAGEERGIPYFAMERVDGCTLGEALRVLVDDGRGATDLAGADLGRAVERATGADEGAARDVPLFAGSWTDACARVVHLVAEALAHAHAQGILHRDVKPSNVMVTPAGRVMLLDFGLSSNEGIERITRTGSALGSLPYMSPEQLEGDWEQLDHRSDVYSLGVTLYELLTLRLPFDAPSVERIRAAIAEGRRRPVRDLTPRVPWEFDTVTAVAMEPEPRRRYATCEAFAADLAAALDGRPIAARRSSAWHRARRWTRRRPAAAALVALTALVVIGGPLAFGFQQRKARLAAEAQGRIISGQRAELADKNTELADTNGELATTLDALQDALDEARDQRDAAIQQEGRAGRNLDRAMRAVEGFLTRIGDEDLRDVPLVHELRGRVLEEALAFYTELLQDQQDDPALRLEAARAARRVGDVQAMLDRNDEAETSLRRAIELLVELQLERPDDVTVAVELVGTRRILVVLHRVRARHAEAERELRRALAIADGSLQDPALNAMRRKLGVSLGATLRELGRYDEARDAVFEVLDELEDAYAANEDDESATGDLAQAHLELGALAAFAIAVDQQRGGSGADAVELSRLHYERAVEVLNAAHERDPEDTVFRRDRARALMNLANILIAVPVPEDAQMLSAEGVAAARELAEDYPGVPTYVEDLGVALGIQGAALMFVGQPGDGVASFEEAEDVFLELVRLQSGRPNARGRLAQAQFFQGQYLWQPTGDQEGALDRLAAAIENYEIALEMEPGLTRRRLELQLAHEYSMKIHLLQDEIGAAVEHVLQWADLAKDPLHRRRAAHWLVQCAIDAEASPSLDEEESADVAGLLDERAAEVVQSLLDDGATANALRGDPLFEDLQTRPVAAAPLSTD
ncbi:MAG: serine/threonine-protein kinase [Planctomycetota bacterium]